MMLPNLRYLSSMRARMTAGFVFILAPGLLIMSAILPIFANRVTEIKDRQQVGWIVERVSQRLLPLQEANTRPSASRAG